MKSSTVKLIAAIITAGLISNTAIAAKNSNAKAKSSKPAKQWYMKTTLEVAVNPDKTIEDKSSGVFGKLDESHAGYDQHDIPAFGSTARSQGAIVFVHGDEWGEKAGEYLSDYHGSNKHSDSWVFNVNSRHLDGEATLSWDGLFVLNSSEINGRRQYNKKKDVRNATLENLQLIHLDTLTVIPAVTNGVLNTYTFNMEGKSSHQFRWVLGPINASYFEPASGAMRYIKAQQHILEQQEAKSRAHPKNHKFGLPPDS